MRKDVKIIMAVCAIVLVGLIVYALFVPGEKTGNPIAPTDNNTTAENNGGAPEPSTQPAIAEINSSTTQPAIAVGPTTTPSETATAENNGSVVGSAVAGGTAASASDWNKMLATGQAPAADSSSAAQSNNTNAGSASGNGSSPMMLEATGSSLTNNTSATPALTPTAAPQMSGTTGQRTYIVKLGDTPTSIAQTEYGNGQLYTKILAANPKLNARHMHVGQKLILPAISEAGGSVIGKTASPTAGMNSSETPAQSAIPAGPHYTVVAGDSLQRIAMKLYGSSAQWQKIYDLNKSKIGSNPAHIHVGEVLQLPKAPTAAQSATAAR